MSISLAALCARAISASYECGYVSATLTARLRRPTLLAAVFSFRASLIAHDEPSTAIGQRRPRWAKQSFTK
jgi:hypothetical protein